MLIKHTKQFSDLQRHSLMKVVVYGYDSISLKKEKFLDTLRSQGD